MNVKPRSGQRSSTYMALYSVLWTFIAFMFMLQLNNYFHVSLSFRITFFIIGASFGVVFSTIITRWQLKKLDKKGEDPTTLKTIFITIAVTVIAIAAILEVAYINLPILESALGYCVFPLCSSNFSYQSNFDVFLGEAKKGKNFSR